nr:MAG TPA: hypothetical protein [Caudoviricetes sp.]
MHHQRTTTKRKYLAHHLINSRRMGISITK